ncbi:MAG: preprotein translocase subunit SecG [Candidatus Pacebacteria bacterium]|nr:preprotein translocase subunit SecG [Candidatus Paceibacterota bacterium]
MSLVIKILPYIEIILGVILVLAILLQQTGSNVGGALGGGDSSSFHSTRRGFEKFLFILSIVCAVLFVASALLSVLIKV